MPSDKFLALDTLKQKQLLDSAKKEFANKKYEDASINQIIKNIKMPRGSFYLYFNNKRDLYYYILKNYVQEFKKSFINILQNNNQDLFLSLTIFYDLIVNNKNNQQLITNIFANINQEQLDCVMPQFIKEEMDGSVIKNINIDNYNLDHNEIGILLSIVLPLFFNAIAVSLKENNQKELIRVHYLAQLNIIKRGLERKEIC